jgi:acyl-CoA synthetase (NDP forming)
MKRDIALLRGTREGLGAIAAVARWDARRPQAADAQPPPLSGDPLPAGALPEYDSCALLERYGVSFPARERCATPAEAAAAFAGLGGPVVVKVDGPAHKQAAGGVVLGITSAEDARTAAQSMGGRVLVARQVGAGVEAFCGLTRDPDFGPVLAVGLGGRAIEALGLAAVALAPLDDAGARALVAEAPGLAQLASEDAVTALADALVALSRLAHDRPEVDEVDINPLILGDNGATAVDALVVVKGAP